MVRRESHTDKVPVVVMFAVDSLLRGGAETVMVRLIGGMDRQRFRPVVWVKTPSGGLRGLLDSMGVPVYNAGYIWRWLGRARRPLALTRGYLAVRRQKIRLIHSFMFEPLTSEALLARVSGARYVVGLRDAGLQSGNPVAMVRLEAADRIVAVSLRSIAAYCRTEAQRAKAVVIHNGIDLAQFHPGRNEGFRASLGIGQEVVVFACVANFWPWKPHRLLVEAMKIVKQTCPAPVRLVMVGKGALRDAVAREIACAGLDKEVRILESDRVEDLLRGCDGFVLPSDTEGCPNALLEALSSGLPCILTDTFGNEFITDGQEGIVVPVRDPRRLAEAIGALAQDGQQRRRMGKAARALAEKKYGLDSMVSKYVAIYEALGCR